MPILLICYLLWCPALVGLGSVLLIISPPADFSNLLFELIAGMTGVGIIVNVLNFFLPVTPIFCLCLLALGWLLLVANRRRIISSLGNVHVPTAIFWGAAWLLLAVLIYYSSPLDPDIGGYYVPTIKWITNSRAIPGTANLIGRIGFNSFWFSISAGLEIPLLAGKSIYILNGLLFWICGLTGSVYMASRKRSLSDLFLAGLSICPVLLAMSPFYVVMICSGSADFPVMIFTLLIIYCWLKMRESSEDKVRFYFIGLMTALGTLGLVIKLSALLLLIPLIFLFPMILRDYWRRWIKLACVMLIILVPFTIRSIAISGCVAYPVYSSCIRQLPWTVSRENAKYEQDDIQSWARSTSETPQEALSSWTWFPSWLGNTAKNPIVLVSLGLIMVGGALWFRAGRPRTKLVLPLIFCAIGLLFWFFAAPDVRFAAGFFFSIGLLILCENLRVSTQLFRPIAVSLQGAAFIFHLSYVVFVLGPSSLVGFPHTPTPLIESLSNGINTPQGDSQCWNAPLPCTDLFFNSKIVTDHGNLIWFEPGSQ